MIKVNITNKELELAKKITKQFDKQKTYNKFNCKTNYRGLLGEIVMNRIVKGTVDWIDFNKQGWDQPDFICNGITLDLKTTVTDVMYFNKVQHDIYIHAQISNDDSTITFKSWMTKDLLLKAKQNGKANKIIDKFNREVYTITPEEMIPIEQLIMFNIKC